MAGTSPAMMKGERLFCWVTLVKRNDSGIVVRPGDGAGFSETIRALARDPRRCMELGRNARMMLDRSFSRLSCLKRREELLDGSAESRSTP
jgi:glycosyltransferase involved in cell wall biosynthesis